jgi:hypothetical protein
MNAVLYVFVFIVVLVLNEYRLIKKHIKGLNNLSNTSQQQNSLGFIQLIVKPIRGMLNWVNYKLLNNELHY